MRVTFIRPNLTPRRSADAIQPLELAVLLGLTPPDVEVELLDERVEELPAELTTDLAAITVQTFTARRAYQLADVLRARGVRVVLGGYHPTARPDEARAHADAVVVGEAEHIWPQVIRDAQHGVLQPFYRQDAPSTLEGVRYDRRHFASKRYSRIVPVEFNRGCHFRCDFCSVTSFHHGAFRTRPVADVIHDLEETRARTALIVDDNLLNDRERTRALLEALVPLRLRWGCQISLDVARDEALLDLMAKSGCVAALVGLESLSVDNLRQMRKANRPSTVLRDIGRLRDRGIMVYASFVFGYDFDTPDIFDRTVDFALENRFFLANFNTLSPMPATPLHERLRREGRLFRDDWWLDARFPYGEVAFRPARMSAEELTLGCLRARRRFFAASSIARRLLDARANCRSPAHLLLYLGTNLVARRELRLKMREVERAHAGPRAPAEARS
jgi:radical SAM superfamily enzyme YgiQ (UPF0313 family)